MAYWSALLWIFSFLFFIFVLVTAIRSIRRYRRNRYLERIPFPPKYRRHLMGIPHYRLLDDPQKAKIERAMLKFIDGKRFLPIELTLTDEMVAVIAFYANLIVLKYEGYGYPLLHSIYVYPNDFVFDDLYSEAEGIYTEERMILDGQSTGEAIVLSWERARHEAYHSGDHNLIIHEFAHALDMQDGYSDGVPPIDDQPDLWERRLHEEYAAFIDAVSNARYPGDYAMIDPYGATNEAEFFAVLSELYFMRPRALKAHLPSLYILMLAFYKLDTAKTFATLED